MSTGLRRWPLATLACLLGICWGVPVDAQDAPPPIITPWRSGAAPSQHPVLDRQPGQALRTATGALESGDVVVMEATGEMLVDLGPGGVDLNDRAVGAAFYEDYPDDFDYLVIFTDFPVALAGGAASGLYVPVSSDIAGINLSRDGQFSESFDFSGEYGASGRLAGVILMGNVATMPGDPNEPNYNAGFSVLNILGQETLHQFGAFVNYRAAGELRRDLLGRSRAHWSFFLHTHGSDLEGNNWSERLPEGDFVAATFGGNFSQLDQYLMGLRLPDQITESYFLITEPEPVDPATATASTGPRRSSVTGGTRLDLDVEMIIDAHGPRIPTARDSPKTFTQAFIMLTDTNGDPAHRDASAEKLSRFRRQWGRYFYDRADGRGRLLSTLDARDDHPRWRFVVSLEGWQVEGADVEVGIDTGKLILKPFAPRVRLFNDTIKVEASQIRYFAIEARTSGLETPCAIPGAFRFTTAPSGSPEEAHEPIGVLMATDGQTHTYTAKAADAPGFAGTLTGLTFEIEVPEEALGSATIEITDLEGAFLPNFPDFDDDGVLDEVDNCPSVSNPTQTDIEGDGIGDACDTGAAVCTPGTPPTQPPKGCDCALSPGRPAPAPWTPALLLVLFIALSKRRGISPAASRGSRPGRLCGWTNGPARRADR